MEVGILGGRGFFIAAIFLVLTAALGGAAGSPSGSGVMGIILPATGADRAFQDVLAGSFTVQFTLRKAALQLADSTQETAFTLRRALSEAAAKNSEYLLVGTYSTTATEIVLQLDLYSVASGERIRSGATSGRIDLSMDTLVAQALEKLLTGVTFRPAAQVVVVPPPDTTPRPLPPATSTPPGPSGAPTPAAAPAQVSKRFGFSTGAAPLIATGPAADYTKLGFLATLAGDFRFPLGHGVLETGILSGVGMLSATGAATDAQILLVPLGMDLRYLLSAGAFPGVILHASGGPALLSVTADYTGNETKIVPYALAGMTVDLPFSPSFGLTLEASYVVFVETSLTIMAFAPEVAMYVQF